MYGWLVKLHTKATRNQTFFGVYCIVMSHPSISDWVVHVPLLPSCLGIGLWSERPGFNPITVRYTGGSGNPGSPVSGSFPPCLIVSLARGLGFPKVGSNVTNQPNISNWVVQVPLWPNGLGVGLWSERPGVRSLQGPLQYQIYSTQISLQQFRIWKLIYWYHHLEQRLKAWENESSMNLFWAMVQWCSMVWTSDPCGPPIDTDLHGSCRGGFVYRNRNYGVVHTKCTSF